MASSGDSAAFSAPSPFSFLASSVFVPFSVEYERGVDLKEDCFKASCWNGEVCLNADDGTEALFIDENTARRCLRIVRCNIFNVLNC